MLPHFSNLRISKLDCRRILQVLAALVVFAAISQCYRRSVFLLAADEPQKVTCRLLDIKREPATAINASEDGNWIALRMGRETGLYDVGSETGLYSTVQRKVVGSWPHGSKVHSFVKRQVQDRKPDASSNDYVALEPVKEEHLPGTATLKIRVVYRGEVPKLPPINAASDPVCANLVIPNETLIVGKEGAIQNAALIWDEKKNPKFKPFDKDNKWRDRVVELKCKDCRFEPHVLVMRAGQKIKQVIVDQTGHSANFGFFNNSARGFLVPVGKPIVIMVPESEPAPVPIECNVHPWMKAHLIVKEHPYIGVSNAEGTIEIDNLPIGENVFRLWHEALAGPMDKVVVNGKEQAINRGRITFSLNAGLNDLGTMELQDSLFKIDSDKK